MNYYGKVFAQVNDFKPVYLFLQKALSKVSEEKPFRGPTFFYNHKMGKCFKIDEPPFSYFSKTDGDVKEFSGLEFITQRNEKIYETNFSGGLINLRS